MPYPKKPKKEDVNAETRVVAPSAPIAERTIKPPTVARATGGAPKVYPQRSNWQGASTGIGSAGKLPTPPPMTLPQTQQQVGPFVSELKTRFDDIVKNKPDVVARNPRFWRAYKEMPEPMATALARRSYSDQLLGSGPVADWMRFLEGNK